MESMDLMLSRLIVHVKDDKKDELIPFKDIQKIMKINEENPEEYCDDLEIHFFEDEKIDLKDV